MDGEPDWGRPDPRLNGGRRGGVTEFTGHFGWDGDRLKEAVEEIDVPDLNEIADRAGVRDDQQHLKAEPLQACPFTLEILQRVVDPDFVALEKRVDLVARCEAKQAPEIGFVQVSLPVFLGDQSLKGPP